MKEVEIPVPFEEYLNNTKDLTEFEIFEGMNEVNCKMAEEIEELLRKEQPTCHFSKMCCEDGFWICEHCGHEKESEVVLFECEPSY